MQRFILIPPNKLETSTLESLLIGYLTIQGYDTTDTTDAGMQSAIEKIKTKLINKELVLIHDLETQTNELMRKEDAKKWLDQDFTTTEF